VRRATIGEETSAAAVCTVRVGSPESRSSVMPRNVRSSCCSGVTSSSVVASYVADRVVTSSAAPPSVMSVIVTKSSALDLIART
jgi:hypothetical protein